MGYEVYSVYSLMLPQQTGNSFDIKPPVLDYQVGINKYVKTVNAGEYNGNFTLAKHVWDIFSANGETSKTVDIAILSNVPSKMLFTIKNCYISGMKPDTYNDDMNILFYFFEADIFKVNSFLKTRLQLISDEII